MKRSLGSILLAAVLLATGAPALAAPPPNLRFRADVEVLQDASWNYALRSPTTGESYCTDGDLHHRYTASGDGQLRVKDHGILTFDRTGNLLESTELRLSATRLVDGEGSVALEGTAAGSCRILPPFPVDRDGCNPLLRRKGTVQMGLMTVGSRLQLLGGWIPAASDALCFDATGYSVIAGWGGLSTRRGIAALIRDRRRKTIRVSGEWKGNFEARELIRPSEAFEILSHGGDGLARWSVKLTRL